MELNNNVLYVEGQEERALVKKETALTQYFILNKNDPNARTILYRNIPEHYCYDGNNKTWKLRKKKVKVIGRVCSVSPKDIERFHLKLLLNFVPVQHVSMI